MSNFTIFTDLLIIVDRSGSMESMKYAHVEQIYSLIHEQQKHSKENDIDTHITLISFDNITEKIIDNQNIQTYNIPEYEYFKYNLSPRGTTRFFDTVIESIEQQKERVQNQMNEYNREVKNLEPCIKRIVYVLTDGHDNVSKKNISELKQFLENENTDEHFNTIFLAANIGDVEELSVQMGFNPRTALTIGNNYDDATYAMSQATMLIREISSNNESTENFGFTPLQRACSISTPNVDNLTITPTVIPDNPII